MFWAGPNHFSLPTGAVSVKLRWADAAMDTQSRTPTTPTTRFIFPSLTPLIPLGSRTGDPPAPIRLNSRASIGRLYDRDRVYTY
jgi:hypothetical protein